MSCSSRIPVLDKQAIDNMTPGDAVVIFTPDSQCSFELWRDPGHDASHP